MIDSEWSNWLPWPACGLWPPLNSSLEVETHTGVMFTGRSDIVLQSIRGDNMRSGRPLQYRVRSGAMPPPTPASAPSGAPAILTKAAKHMEDRAATYDTPGGERSMARTVAAFNAVLGREAITESEGWLFMQLLKDVRDRQRAAAHTDSLEDCVAYAALKAEARLRGV